MVAGAAAIKLVKKSAFSQDSFGEVADEAAKVIRGAKDDDILALTITFNSPLKVVKAVVFDRSSFNDLLALKSIPFSGA